MSSWRSATSEIAAASPSLQSLVPSTSRSGARSGTSNGAGPRGEGRSARAGRRPRAGCGDAPPSARGACARAAARLPSRRARPAATRPGPSVFARPRRDRRSPGTAPRTRPRPGRGSLLAPFSEEPARVGVRLGKGQMDDVMGALCEIKLALLGSDDVVRRRDQILERPGLPLVVPQRPKRLDLGQRGHLTIRFET